MPSKKQPSLQALLRKEVTDSKNKVKHPDARSHNEGGHYSLTRSTLAAFRRSPGPAKANPSVESLTAGLYRNSSPLYTKMNCRVGSPVVGSHSYGSVSPESTKTPTGSTTRRHRDINSVFVSRGRESVESIFGEGLPSAREQKLEQLLAKSALKFHILKPTRLTNLQELKEELKQLALRETNKFLTNREWGLIQRTKEPLKEEIRYMEQSERRAFEETRAKKIVDLPEPVDHFEKKRLEQAKKRIQMASAGERSLKRRHNDCMSEKFGDSDLDGEERLRLGKSLKRKRLQITGHFWSTRHSFSPGLPDAEIVTTKYGGKLFLENLCNGQVPKVRKPHRTELAECVEMPAKPQRWKND